MLKLCIAAVIVAIMSVILKQIKAEYALIIGIALSLIIMGYVVVRLKEIISVVDTIRSYINIDAAYISILIKIVGITYIAEFASSICKDAGCNSASSQIEIAGKLTMLAISMPVVIALLETVEDFLS